MADQNASEQAITRLEVDGKKWRKVHGHWYYQHRGAWQKSPESFDVFFDAIAAKDARIAELEGEAVNRADQLHQARSDSHKLSALRAAIEAKAREFRQRGNLNRKQNDPLKEGSVIAWDAAADALCALLEEGK